MSGTMDTDPAEGKTHRNPSLKVLKPSGAVGPGLTEATLSRGLKELRDSWQVAMGSRAFQAEPYPSEFEWEPVRPLGEVESVSRATGRWGLTTGAQAEAQLPARAGEWRGHGWGLGCGSCRGCSPPCADCSFLTQALRRQASQHRGEKGFL